MSVANYHTDIDGRRAVAFPSKQCKCQVSSKSLHRCGVRLPQARLQNLLLWGDSHAMVSTQAFDQITCKSKNRVDFDFQGAYLPLSGIRNSGSADCLDLKVRIIEMIKTEWPVTIIMIASLHDYNKLEREYSLNGNSRRHESPVAFKPTLHETIEAIRIFTAKIILIALTPQLDSSNPFFSLVMTEWRPDITSPALLNSQCFCEFTSWFCKVTEHYHYARQLWLVGLASWFCSSQACAYRESIFVVYRDCRNLRAASADFITRHLTAKLLGGTQISKP